MKTLNAFRKLFATTGKLGFLLSLVLAVSCAPNLRVGSDYNHSASLTSYKTFNIQNQTMVGMIGQIQSDRIINAVRSEMISKGYLESADPDVVVNVLTIVKDNRTISVNTVRPRPLRYGPMITSVSVNDYKDGSIVIDVLDAKKKTVLWTGTGTAEIKSQPRNPDRVISTVVSKVMASFPTISKQNF